MHQLTLRSFRHLDGNADRFDEVVSVRKSSVESSFNVRSSKKRQVWEGH